jgi:hypothetical protein
LEILVGKLAELGLIEMLNYGFESIASQFEVLAETAEVHVDSSLDFHVE